SHAKSEFNLAVLKKQFSYCEAIISLCNLLQNLAKNKNISTVMLSQKKRQASLTLVVFDIFVD
ncbi:MAG: hypothetical protein Q4A86_05420, partial [Clostridia bacterium]|nr:hypothetical protein [Clostridia bacterium]